MRLIKLPNWETDTIEVTLLGDIKQRISGVSRTSEVEIVVPDEFLTDEDEFLETWQTLKYGPKADLADAMYKSKKIPRIDFYKDGVSLMGVMPYDMYRTSVWKGRVFRCRVDYFEITDERKFNESYRSQQ